jgi:hypothetical protein
MTAKRTRYGTGAYKPYSHDQSHFFGWFLASILRVRQDLRRQHLRRRHQRAPSPFAPLRRDNQDLDIFLHGRYILPDQRDRRIQLGLTTPGDKHVGPFLLVRVTTEYF